MKLKLFILAHKSHESHEFLWIFPTFFFLYLLQEKCQASSKSQSTWSFQHQGLIHSKMKRFLLEETPATDLIIKVKSIHPQDDMERHQGQWICEKFSHTVWASFKITSLYQMDTCVFSVVTTVNEQTWVSFKANFLVKLVFIYFRIAREGKHQHDVICVNCICPKIMQNASRTLEL